MDESGPKGFDSRISTDTTHNTDYFGYQKGFVAGLP